MAVVIKFKRNGTASAVPTTLDVASGEPCINTADQKLYVNMNGTIVTFVPEVKNEWNKSTDPGSGDDANDGYVQGSHWYNSTLSSMWICVDATVGSAVWEQLS